MMDELLFRDRTDAAERLAERLAPYRGRDPLVLGIPLGSLPMARIIADRLGGDLDAVLVRKIGAPDNPELAVGSVSEFGDVFRSHVAEFYGIGAGYLQAAARKELRTLRERRRAYAPYRSPIDPRGRLVILVDDGIATGATLLAAIRAIRAKAAARIVVAAPVASSNAAEAVELEADETVLLVKSATLRTVGQFYRDFRPLSEGEALAALIRRTEDRAA